MQFSDLPNGGKNLRLYTYDPVGSQFGPLQTCGQGTPTWILNSGHFDISLGIPCSQPDPQGFCNWTDMQNYAAGRGETIVMVSRSDLTALCNYRVPTTVKPVTSGGLPLTNTNTPVNLFTGPAATPPGYIPSPGTPVDQGGVPTGQTSGQTAGGASQMPLYRFILYNPSTTDPNNPYSTGANYPGCSQVNSAACKGMNFPSEAAAVQYAESHGEIPYRILTAGEVWGIINGSIPIDPARLLGSSAQGMSWGMIAAIAAGLWFISGR